MILSLSDLHCDTLYEIFAKQKSVNDPSLAVSLDPLAVHPYQKHTQVTAIWSDSSLSDEDSFLQCVSILEQLQEHRIFDCFYRGVGNASFFLEQSKAFLLGVEDARLLSGEISRLTFLHQKGVRILTLLWKGVSCIGGAYDTDRGLTAFGKEVVTCSTELGIVCDISHASIRSAYDTIEMANGAPVIASHSDSFSVYPHPRNITDSLFSDIKQTGGLVGINLYDVHLGMHALRGTATDMILRHIDHFLSIGGEDVICFGCDFDGAQTPLEYQHPEDLYSLSNEMVRRGYSERVIQKIFWKNADRFIMKHIIKNNDTTNTEKKG